MRHLNLLCTVGRAAPLCVGSFDYADAKSAEIAADGAQAAKSSELQRSGIGLDRVRFERQYIDVTKLDSKGQPVPQAAGFAVAEKAATAPKKGKR